MIHIPKDLEDKFHRKIGNFVRTQKVTAFRDQVLFGLGIIEVLLNLLHCISREAKHQQQIPYLPLLVAGFHLLQASFEDLDGPLHFLLEIECLGGQEVTLLSLSDAEKKG